jgi:hypothetical protein
MQSEIDEMEYYLPYEGDDRFFAMVDFIAKKYSKNEVEYENNVKAIIQDELEKAYISKEQEINIDFDDEIVEIEELDEMELIDITVTRDNLFYANGILTKNSYGIPATADFMLLLTRTEELDEMQQISCKVLKNRYRNSYDIKKFYIGVDLMTQRLYQLENSEQDETVSEPSALKSQFQKNNKWNKLNDDGE